MQPERWWMQPRGICGSKQLDAEPPHQSASQTASPQGESMQAGQLRTKQFAAEPPHQSASQTASPQGEACED